MNEYKDEADTQRDDGRECALAALGQYRAPDILRLGRAVEMIRGACSWRNADQGVANYYW